MNIPWLDNTEIWKIMRHVDWQDPAFDIHKLYIMSLFSKLVYHKITDIDLDQYRRATVVPCFAFQELIAERRSDIEELVARMDGQLIDIIERKYFVAAIVRIGPITVIAIRGTAALYDWTINFNARTVSFQGGRMHRGFFAEVIATLRELSETPHLDGDIIYATGHSLGGALAALLSRIASPSIAGTLVSVYSFGMPRSGDNRSDYPWVRPYSCIREGDPVPNTPPKFLGYEDPAFLCEPAGKPASFDRRSAVRDFIAFNVDNFRLSFAQDHAMERYIEDVLTSARACSPLLSAQRQR